MAVACRLSGGVPRGAPRALGPALLVLAASAPLAVWVAAAFAAPGRQRLGGRGIPRVQLHGLADGTPSPTLKPRIWDMLGLKPGADKDEIRKGYKQFVLMEHPDRTGKDDPKFKERFRVITAAYKKVMKMSDDEFWLERFDAGVTAVYRNEVNSPSLNPWERRYKEWDRKRREEEQAARDRQERMVDPAVRQFAAAVKAADAARARRATPTRPPAASQEGMLRPDQLFLGALLAGAALVFLCFLIILATSLAG
uniref:J domain-containing protein n=1 Tax=Pyrodinium bahamense TaxID=73915 RepID=A0A7S0AGG2_9DINO|eukprot:CAMPEP_0179071406 /NCGR_PEP_ID=MMETSP0796-20121207/31515_1 /TAXON_ID=73915 /ORGANISM="Pyrodinium bahamense, Strain pbaha01" /LENGTH=252 /DNA_ID=CAMNT_0020768519 /DNA_START=32 /DNA_END=790 /DNA_ORIENTATION=-